MEHGPPDHAPPAEAGRPPARPPLAGPLACLLAGSAGPCAWSSGSGLALAAAAAAAALAARAIARGSGARRILLISLALLAGLRAAERLAAGAAGAADPSGAGLLERTGASGNAPGIWTEVRRDAESTAGSMAGTRDRLVVSTGVVEAGATVRLLGGLPRLLARGPAPANDRFAPAPSPAPAPRSSPPIARIEIPSDEVVRLRGGPRRPWDPALRSLRGLRTAGCRRLAELDDRRLAGFLGALVFGERAGLDFELADLFTRTGTRHLLALSGLHVVLAAALFAWPLGSLAGWLIRRLPSRCALRRESRARWTRALVRAAAVLCFVPLGGEGTPVARAAIAAALAALAPALGNTGLPRGAGLPIDGKNLWCWALGWELLADPLALREVGVQLSYGATLGLLLGATRMQGRIQAMLPGGGALAPAGPTGLARPHFLRALAARASRFAAGATSASLMATACTLPVVWLHFGEWAPAGMLATPAAVPAIAALLCLGAVRAALPWAVPEAWLAAPFETLLAGLARIDEWPWTPLVLPAGVPWFMLLAGLAAAAWLFRKSGSSAARAAGIGRPMALVLGAFLAGRLLPAAHEPAPPGLEVVALDVGHGTAVLLRSEDSGTWLFDAGSRDRLGVARAALLPVLRRWGPGPLTVVASHLDRDHVGALDWVAQRFPIRAWYGALPESVARLLPAEVPRLDLGTGRALLSRSGDFEASLLRGRDGPGNEGSRMLEIAFGSRRVLLTGDAEAGGLRETLERASPAMPVDLLLLPHHGSHTEQLGPLLDHVRPALAWASASRVPPAASELLRRGIPLEATWSSGPLVWRTAGESAGRPGKPDGGEALE